MSVPILWQNSMALTLGWTYVSAGAYQTGKTINFRLVANGVGNQATTGITFTEVDATHNPGVYDINIASNAPMLATNGVYHLQAYDSATPANFVDFDIIITSNGQVAPNSNVFFSAAALNGRVTDGNAIPLQGVTIIVTRAGKYVTTLTSDVNGLFTYFNVAGTDLLYYQKAGYAQGSATVTFTGLAATGPGVDVSLIAAAGVGSILAQDLWTYARRQCFDQVGPSANAKIISAVNKAQDRMAMSKKFNWWLTRAFLNFNANIAVSINLVNGSPTIACPGANLPTTWQYVRLFFNSQIMDVVVTAGNSATMAQNWNGPTGTYSAQAIQTDYQLPINMFQFGSILPGQNWGWGGDPVDAKSIWEIETMAIFGQQQPSRYGVHQGRLLIWPYATLSTTTAYCFWRRPIPLVNASDVADFDNSQLLVMHAAIQLEVAKEFGKSVAGTIPECEKLWMEAIAVSSSTDRQPSALPSMNQHGMQLPQWKTRRAN